MKRSLGWKRTYKIKSGVKERNIRIFPSLIDASCNAFFLSRGMEVGVGFNQGRDKRAKARAAIDAMGP